MSITKHQTVKKLKLPKIFFKETPLHFIAKFSFSIAMISLGSYLCLGLIGFYWIPIGILINGLMFAHLVEFQHECLHHHAFKLGYLNDLFGIASGIPMLNAYYHYRALHLAHHAKLGTIQNTEFFEYSTTELSSVSGLLRAMFSFDRYKTLASNMMNAFKGLSSKGVCNQRDQIRIRWNYIFLFCCLLSAVSVSFYFSSTALIYCWFIPLLIVAEPSHFLIELPEHLGLPAYSETNVFKNTRTIRGSWLSFWFTNGNNFHTAHHYNQGVSMQRVPKLQELIAADCEEVFDTYWKFYRAVLTNNLGKMKSTEQNEKSPYIDYNIEMLRL